MTCKQSLPNAKQRVRIIFACLLFAVLILAQGASAATRITWWIGSWDEEVSMRAKAEFEAMHPDIEVVIESYPYDGMYNKYLLALRGGTGPDVLSISNKWNHEFAARGFLHDLTPYLGAMGGADSYIRSGLVTAEYEGGYYGIPFRVQGNMMIYNRRMFEEAGLDPNVPPDTWEELIEYGLKLTRGDEVYGIGFPGRNASNTVGPFAMALLANGGDLLNGSWTAATVQEEPGVRALTLWYDMYNKYNILPRGMLSYNRDDIEELFVREKVAMISADPSIVPKIEQSNPDLDWAAMLPPRDVSRGAIVSGWNFTIPKTTRHFDAALEFLTYLSTPSVQAYYTVTLPGRLEAFDDPRFDGQLYEVALATLQASESKPWPPLAQTEAMVDRLYLAIQQALIGELSPQAALDEAANSINSMLKQ